MLFSMRYQAGAEKAQRGSTIAAVTRDEASIGLWQEQGGSFARVTDALKLPTLVPAGGTTQIRLKIQFPLEPGDYTLSIGPWNYTLKVSGRRQRTPTGTTPTYQRVEASSSRATIRMRSSSSRANANSSSVQTQNFASQQKQIRIRLYQTGTMRIATADASSVTLTPEMCTAIRRFTSPDGIVTITDDNGNRRVRGVVECRVLDGEVVLINELPLEHYLWGLAEEPDTEPYEKQRAFAIAARTYAAYYMNPAYRKFPGKPYDGSDSPAEFQAYKGYDFESSHTQWVRATKDTAAQVLTKDGQLIRPPYFSSDDGRTRTPEEAKWNNFPFAEIFTAKADPWCAGQPMHGHGVGMSGCGAEGQANEGKTAEEILSYYYPTTLITRLR